MTVSSRDRVQIVNIWHAEEEKGAAATAVSVRGTDHVTMQVGFPGSVPRAFSAWQQFSCQRDVYI